MPNLNSERDEHVVRTTLPSERATDPPPQIDTLPSTVADSQDIINAVAATEQDYREVVVTKAVGSNGVKMSSQDVGGEPTQEASSSLLNSVLARSRSARQVGDDQPQEVETQRTLEPGDDGHIDILSSFLVHHGSTREDSQDIRDQESVRSPSEPTQISILPSPVFKTPATTSRKRNSEGDLIDSPLLPRNPLARTGMPTPGKGLGLSQVFAGTQLGSSPGFNPFSVELPSDRPSPSIEVQARPATASLTTPLQNIEFRRATTEPASRYVSLRESQARREMLERQKELAELQRDESYDDFDEPSSPIRRALRQRDRDLRIANNTKTLSSPTRASAYPARASKSSPLRPQHDRASRYDDRSTSPCISVAPDKPELSVPTEDMAESEQETEQEDDELEFQAADTRSPLDIEEDKENIRLPVNLLVPRTTTKKLQRVMLNSGPSQASPPSTHVAYAEDTEMGYDSGRVPNSQPSQSRHTNVRSEPRPSSSAEAVDFVPQSLTPPPDSPPSLSNPAPVTDIGEEDDVEEDVRPPTTRAAAVSKYKSKHEVTNQAHSVSTVVAVPETSSERLRGGHSTSSHQTSKSAQDKSTSSGDNVNYETAATHPPASTGPPRVSQLSSQPIPRTPPGQKRKRKMADIADEVSPRQESQDVTTPFSANRAIGLDGIADVLSRTSTPAKVRTYSRKVKRRRTSHNSARDAGHVEVLHERSSPARTLPHPTNSGQAPNNDTSEAPEEGEGMVSADGVNEKGQLDSDDIITSRRQIRSSSSERKRRRTAWDVDASPPKAAPIVKPRLIQRLPPGLSTRGVKRGWDEHAHETVHDPVTSETSAQPASAGSPAKRSRLSTRITAKPNSNTDDLAKKDATSKNQAGARNKPKTRKSAPQDLDPDDDVGQGSVDPHAVSPESPDPLALPGDGIESVDHDSCSEIVAPNMVFAVYNGKSRAYYPALCLGAVESTPKRYQIQWEGYEPDTIDAYGICRLDLRVGDLVKVELQGFPRVSYIIRGFRDKVDTTDKTITDIRGFKTLLVAPKQRKSLPANLTTDTVKEVPVSAVYLDSNMWNQMKDRSYTFQPTSAVRETSGSSTPAPLSSTPSTPSSRSRKQKQQHFTKANLDSTTSHSDLFSNMAFAISYDADHSDHKTRITDLIQAHGGTMLPNSFEDLFDTTSSTAEKSSLPRLKPQYTSLSFTAHITDTYNRRAKYLQALALGIPCLSGRWIESCVKAAALVPWTDYLLPSGESQHLDNAVRSRTLSPSNMAKDAGALSLREILDASPDILGGAEVVVVQGKGASVRERQETFGFLVRCMKAGRMAKVGDVNAAIKLLMENEGDGLEQSGEKKRYLFVHDRSVESAKLMVEQGGLRDVQVIGNEFIVQSLILGRLHVG